MKSADSPPHKAGQSAVHAQKPPELLGVLSKFLPHNGEQSASQGPDCPPHKEAPHQKFASFWWAGKTHRRTVRAPGPDSPPWTESPPPETLSFWWPPQSPLRTIRPAGPDSPPWTERQQPETQSFWRPLWSHLWTFRPRGPDSPQFTRTAFSKDFQVSRCFF